MRRKKVDPFAFAMSSTRATGGRPGWFDSHPRAKADLDKFVKAWKAGSTMSMEQAKGWMKHHHGCPLTSGAILAHVKNHYGKVYNGE